MTSFDESHGRRVAHRLFLPSERPVEIPPIGCLRLTFDFLIPSSRLKKNSGRSRQTLFGWTPNFWCLTRSFVVCLYPPEQCRVLIKGDPLLSTGLTTINDQKIDFVLLGASKFGIHSPALVRQPSVAFGSDKRASKL